jgi:hypothetical protein
MWREVARESCRARPAESSSLVERMIDATAIVDKAGDDPSSAL